MEIIGLSGYARSGKDEAAKVLVNEFGFTRVAFADKLREVLYALNPVVGVDVGKFDLRGHGIMHDQNEVSQIWTRLRDLINAVGWEGYKETRFGSEVRGLLQRLGTEAGRQTLWDTIWIDAAFNGTDADKIVVTDARFFNEFDAIRERGGKIWRIEREGVGPANDHPSETEAVDYPYFEEVLLNNDTVEDWHNKIREVYQESQENDT